MSTDENQTPPTQAGGLDRGVRAQAAGSTNSGVFVAGSTVNSAPMVAPFSNTLSQPFTLKLDRNNFPLWK